MARRMLLLEVHDRMNQVIVEVCSRTFAYPSECPCCGAEPNSELLIPFKASSRIMADDTARQQLFPYCRECVEHVAIWEAGTMISAQLMLGGIISGLIVGFTASVWYGLLVFAAAVALGALIASMIESRARSRCQPSCAAAAKAVTYFGWSGSTSTFAFASASYTARFAEENAPGLVSVDHALRNLLEAHKVARIRVPTPVTAARVIPPPRSIDEWLAHLEHQPSRVARRVALTRALSVIHGDDWRKRVVDLVCRAELLPFLEQIDALPRSRKKQQMERAIASIRADNVPEALRDAQLSVLKKRSLDLG